MQFEAHFSAGRSGIMSEIKFPSIAARDFIAARFFSDHEYANWDDL